MTKQRIVQIMPAPGWSAVYESGNGHWERTALVGFALVETWEPDPGDDRGAPAGHYPVGRYVVPLEFADDYADIEEPDNRIWVVHDRDWNEEHAAKLAQLYAERQRADKARRPAGDNPGTVRQRPSV